MPDTLIALFNQAAEQIIQHLQSEFAKLQTGRASAALIEDVRVEAYGQVQPLKTVAGIMIEDARTFRVQPWDSSILKNVEKALQNANFGSTPVNDGSVIRLNLPPMTEERREQMKKLVHALAEEARISVRQQRQEIHDKVKREMKEEDRRYTLLEELDKAVKEANDTIEGSMKKKEQEVMTV